MVYPLLPAFVTGVLGGGAVALGALDGAADAAAAFVKLVAGRLADRPSRRGPLIVGGYFLAAAVRPIIAVTAAAWQVVALRVVDRLGKGLRTPPRDALIADVTPAPLVGRAFGLQRGLDHVGAVIGPLVAWWMLATGADVRKVILASLVPGVLVLVLAMWAVRGGRRRYGAVEAQEPSALPPPTAPSRRIPPAVIAITAFYLLRMPETLIILHAQRLGIAVALVPLLWAAVHVVKSATSFVGGALSDRIGPSRTMWIGWVTYVALAAGMAFAAGPLAGWILFLALGVVAGLTESPERALVSAAAGTQRGSGFGVYHAFTGVAALAGGLLLGVVFQEVNGATAFFVSAGGALGLVILWPFWTRSHRVPPR
jgi:MFS family permease